MHARDEDSIGKYVGHAERSKQRKQFENQFDEDLSHLDDWAKNLESCLHADYAPNRLVGMIYRPHDTAVDAMMRLSVEYPHVIKQIDRVVDFANENLKLLAEGDHRAASVWDAILTLRFRIPKAIDAMRSGQSRAMADPDADGASAKNAAPRLTLLQERVHELIQQHPEGIMGKQICRKIDINQSTLTSHVIPILKDHYHVKNRSSVGYYVDTE